MAVINFLCETIMSKTLNLIQEELRFFFYLKVLLFITLVFSSNTTVH